MTTEMVPASNAVSADMLAPYRDAIELACDAAGEARLPLGDAALVLLTRAYPTYLDDATTLVMLGTEWIAELLWCGEDKAIAVAARPLPGDGGDAIWVPRTVVEMYFGESDNGEAMAMLQAAGELVPILLLADQSGLFFAEAGRPADVLP